MSEFVSEVNLFRSLEELQKARERCRTQFCRDMYDEAIKEILHLLRILWVQRYFKDIDSSWVW